MYYWVICYKYQMQKRGEDDNDIHMQKRDMEISNLKDKY